MDFEYWLWQKLKQTLWIGTSLDFPLCGIAGFKLGSNLSLKHFVEACSIDSANPR